MTDTTGGMPPAGWYPDPYGQPFERWWDGTGWTEHTNTPAAPEPAAPVAPVTPEPVAAQPVAYEPVSYEPVAYEPVAYEPVAAEPVRAEPVTVPPPLEEPPAATSDPFAGFVSPAEPAPYQAPAFEAPVFAEPVYQAPVFDPAPAFDPAAAAPTPVEPARAEPAPYTPPMQGYEPEPSGPVFGADLFGQQEPALPVEQLDRSQHFSQPTPAAQQTTPGAANAASSFDFGFGEIISGGPAPSNSSVQAPPGEEGLFNSWEPNEYVEELRNGPASAGLALGVLSFFLSALTGLPGLIASVVGIGRASQFDREGAGPVGRGKAIAGLALSIVGSAVSAALILYGLQLYNASQEQTADPGSDTAADAPLTGALGLEVGDMGTITLADSDAAAIQFTVTAITTNFTCTAPDAVSPENGQFVAVALAFTLSPDYLSRMEGNTPLHMYQSDWIGFVGAEGGTQIDSTDAGNSCIPAAEQLPADFAAGENISGTIVLDMAEGITSISYAPSGVTGIDPGMTRWEWLVPA